LSIGADRSRTSLPIGQAARKSMVRHLELSRDIRAVWQYNNLCYNVASLLIERVSGQSLDGTKALTSTNYEAFIRSRLTGRLGMTVSFTLEELEASIDAARPYMMHEDERLPALRLPIRPVAAGELNAPSQTWHTGCGCISQRAITTVSTCSRLH
jgi:CubicO group peptidase (beta-lactamase class C family)